MVLLDQENTKMLSIDNQQQGKHPNENQNEISDEFENYMEYVNSGIASPNIVVSQKMVLDRQHMLFKKTFMQLITWLYIFYHSTISSAGQIIIHVISQHFGHFKYDSSSIDAFSDIGIQGNEHKWIILSLAAVHWAPARLGIQQAQFLCFSKKPIF